MRQLEIENQLRDVVSRIIVQVELATSQGRTDINLALEDAFILGRCLKDDPKNPELAFKRYEATRIARTTAIVEGSAQNAKRFHNPALADPEAAIAYLDDQWAPQKVRQRYDWLFEYDATTAPLVELADRKVSSNAADSAASSVHAPT